jgi:hypothetical protein
MNILQALDYVKESIQEDNDYDFEYHKNINISLSFIDVDERRIVKYFDNFREAE